MSAAAWIPIVAVALVLLATVIAYNRFVQQRQLIVNAWSNVDTELQRRHDLIPNLVETVKGFAAHERATFEEVTAARAAAVQARGSAATQQGAENAVTAGLRHLLAVSEAYPQLKGSMHFLQLQEELVNTENRIQAARRLYNGNVRTYNERVATFPSSLIAKLGKFAQQSYFEVESSVRAVPTVGF